MIIITGSEVVDTAPMLYINSESLTLNISKYINMFFLNYASRMF